MEDTLVIPEISPELPEVETDTVDIENLGTCEVIKIHDDGDLTVKCGGKRYMVTPEGDIFVERGLGNE